MVTTVRKCCAAQKAVAPSKVPVSTKFCTENCEARRKTSSFGAPGLMKPMDQFSGVRVQKAVVNRETAATTIQSAHFWGLMWAVFVQLPPIRSMIRKSIRTEFDANSAPSCIPPPFPLGSRPFSYDHHDPAPPRQKGRRQIQRRFSPSKMVVGSGRWLRTGGEPRHASRRWFRPGRFQEIADRHRFHLEHGHPVQHAHRPVGARKPRPG